MCVRVERAVMCGADVAETRRRASCTYVERPVCDGKNMNRQSEQMESESVRHKARMRMRERASVHVRVRACQATDTHSLQDRVFVSRA